MKKITCVKNKIRYGKVMNGWKKTHRKLNLLIKIHLIVLLLQSLKEWGFLQLFLAWSSNVKDILLSWFHSWDVLIQWSQFSVRLGAAGVRLDHYLRETEKNQWGRIKQPIKARYLSNRSSFARRFLLVASSMIPSLIDLPNSFQNRVYWPFFSSSLLLFSTSAC